MALKLAAGEGILIDFNHAFTEEQIVKNWALTPIVIECKYATHSEANFYVKVPEGLRYVAVHPNMMRQMQSIQTLPSDYSYLALRRSEGQSILIEAPLTLQDFTDGPMRVVVDRFADNICHLIFSAPKSVNIVRAELRAQRGKSDSPLLAVLKSRLFKLELELGRVARSGEHPAQCQAASEILCADVVLQFNAVIEKSSANDNQVETLRALRVQASHLVSTAKLLCEQYSSCQKEISPHFYRAALELLPAGQFEMIHRRAESSWRLHMDENLNLEAIVS